MSPIENLADVKLDMNSGRTRNTGTATSRRSRTLAPSDQSLRDAGEKEQPPRTATIATMTATSPQTGVYIVREYSSRKVTLRRAVAAT